jgi:coenzyme F420-reducing hydrogenase alpha subunit
VGQPNVFPLAETNPDIVKRALGLKALGNELTTLVGGRPVHPITAVIGGFTAEPSKRELETFAGRLHAAARDAAATAELFATFDIPTFATAGEMLAMKSDTDYAIYEGDICALDAGWCRPADEYQQFVTETVVGHSNSKHSTVDGRTFMVGALPRVNLNWDRLLPAARIVATKAGLRPVSRNPFHNNLCQAIELVDAAERCAMLCEKLVGDDGSSAPVSYDIKPGVGTASTEAPRGTLYHTLGVDTQGLITAGNVITPTAQNLANLEADMRAFAPTVVGLPEEEFILRIEQLVRAYDPCLSCAVH